MRTYQKSGNRGGALTFIAALAVFLFTVGLFVGLFWWYGRDYARVSLERQYYFLVRDCEDTTAAAVAGQSYNAGGAGYVLETSGKSCVALACYFSEQDAERVLGAMREKEVSCYILALGTKEFSLSGGDAAQKERIEGNVETVETCARILYETANGLERTSLSQEGARAAVRGTMTSLRGLASGNEERFFDLWNAELISALRRGETIADGILFSKDLRYLQVKLCMAIVNADRYFS